jgi:hypothetical protein
MFCGWHKSEERRAESDMWKLTRTKINHLNAELNPICHFLALLGAHQILHVSRIRVNMKFELLTGKKLSYNVAEGNGVFLI